MKYFTCITCMLWCLTVASPYVVPKKGGGFNGRQSHDRGWAHAVYENEIPDTPKEELNCHDYFELRTDSIVRTKDSLKAGAKFISAPNVNTADECLEQCLCDPGVESDYCDMAVFEQNNKNCYLFNCVVNKVNKCLFAHHEGYFSMVYDSGSFTKAEQAGKHAGDLTDVREGNDENVHEGKQPIPKEPTEPGIVHLPTTISTTTTTTTTKVQKCSRYEFQCDNGDCIGIYYACDTIAHCLDRSDEKGCDYVKHMEPVYATPKADESKLDDYHNNRNSDHKYDYQQKASSEYGNFEQQYKNNNGRNNNLGYTDSHRSRNREKTDEANYQKSYHNSHPDNTHDKMEQNYDAQDNVDKNSPPHGRGKGAAEHKQGGDGRKYSETVTAPALLINKLTSKVPAPSVQLYHYVSEYDASNDGNFSLLLSLHCAYHLALSGFLIVLAFVLNFVLVC